MSSYRRYVAEHGAATARAIRQIRRHGLETGPDSGRHLDLFYPEPISPAECPDCSHRHVEGSLCLFTFSRDRFCGCSA